MRVHTTTAHQQLCSYSPQLETTPTSTSRGRLNQLWSRRAMEYYSATKRNEFWVHAATQETLKIITLRESQWVKKKSALSPAH